jgi:CubicO group peptidase (beta-lactamase class C family)
MKPIAAKLLRLLAVAAVAALVLATVTPPTGIRAGPAASPVSAALGPTDPGEVEAFFDDLMPRQLKSERVVGAAVAVVKDGRLLFAKGYGYAGLERGRPVEAERTLFYPGSTGKLFTWTAVMQLAEQGKLDLHADVNRYLDFAIAATYPQPITLAHLLTHTAGFEEEMGLMLAASQREVPPLREVLVERMPPRVYPPGELSAYSNYGTALAGYVVERVSGQPFEAYIAEHILTPLGMERSAAVQPLPAHLADLAGTYVPARVAHTSPQKLVDWIKAVDVAVDGDNRLLLAGRPYAEIAPGLFVQVGGERRMAFGRDARGRVTHLFWGPIAYLKVPWYQAPMVQLGLLTLCVAVLASALVAWPVHAWVARRRGDPPSPREARAARWLGALVGASSCALVGARS